MTEPIDKMSPDEHRGRHAELHKKLDELLADFIDHTGRLLSETTILELIQWSFEQTKKPKEKESE